MHPTTAFTVKANAFGLLEVEIPAAFDDDPNMPAVTYGFPGEVDTIDELVFLGQIEADDDWGDLGRGQREENYTIDLVINVAHQGQTQQEVTERARDILIACDSIITGAAASALLPAGAAGNVNTVFRRLVERPTDAGREAEITAGIRVYAKF